ncbi:MAG: hypothetical protein IT450_09650 [Phycisphaerales bacterium]|nr:hypothetical protein [Phycisphaerales bacterium]
MRIGRENHAGILFAGMVLECVIASAQTPGTAFTYQGRLESSGVPAAGMHDLRFRLWVSEDDPNSPIGPIVCNDNVEVTEGLFTTQLDFGSNVFVGIPLWLGIEVRTDATAGNCDSGSYTLLSPRQPLRPTPYAVYAASAGTAGLRLPFSGSASIGGGALLTLENTRTAGTSHTGIFWNRSTGDDSRAISGISQAASGLTYGLYGQSISNGGVGVHGESFGIAGVRGIATNTDLITSYGGYFQSAAGNGFGVYGYGTAAQGGNYGVYGRTDSPTGRAIYGYATAGSGTCFGVYGRTDSPSGRAVVGESTALSGTAYGGRFTCVSTGGYAVFARAGNSTGTNYGVYGESLSPGGYGIYGKGAESGVGVYGTSSGGAPFNTSSAVYGEIINGTPSFSYAGMFIGDVNISQSLIVHDDLAVAGTKSFKIDHPLDPANKYLVHYCTESPEPLNVYRGNVVLDDAGRAWIDLPSYFEAVNRDLSYSLTPIGAAAPNLHVAAEVHDNRFQIAGGGPGLKVSWRVEAVRNDAWVRAHGAPVEVEKPPHERGKYLQPEVHGASPEMGIEQQHRRRPTPASPGDTGGDIDTRELRSPR